MNDPAYPWIFDIEERIGRSIYRKVLQAVERRLWYKMELLPWQHFIEEIFTAGLIKTGLRRFGRRSLLSELETERSALICGNGTYAASTDGERGAGVYILAQQQGTKRGSYSGCGTQNKTHRFWLKFQSNTRRIYYDQTNSRFSRLQRTAKI